MLENILWVLAAVFVGGIALLLLIAGGVLVVWGVAKALGPIANSPFWNARKAERVGNIVAAIVAGLVCASLFFYFGSLVLAGLEVNLGWPDVPAWMSEVLEDK